MRSKIEVMDHEHKLVAARAALDVGDFETAYSLSRSVLHRELSNVEALRIRASAAEALGNLSSSWIAHSQIGTITRTGTPYESAAEICIRRLEYHPYVVGCFESAAENYRHEGKFKLAERALARAAYFRKVLELKEEGKHAPSPGPC